jgi:seryl-tRNA synthetase
MLDPQLLRQDLDQIRTAMAARGQAFDPAPFQALEARRKTLQAEVQDLQQRRNAQAKAVGEAKAQGADPAPLLAEVDGLGGRLAALEKGLEEVQAQIEGIVLLLPNIPHASVPVGQSEKDNAEVHRRGQPPTFAVPPKDHVDLGAALGQMDFEAATRIAGARFVVLSGGLARMQRALVQFMLDIHTREHGYREVYVPYLVNERSMRGTGQLPKFKEDLFAVPEQGYYLIPTAEVPVTNLAQDQILEGAALPVRYVCHSPCFRSEAGSYGRDTRGMIRQHQFEKVELVQFVHPERSYEALEELTGHAEAILDRLELPYRRIVLCTGDQGFSSAKTYDLEVWLPSQNTYREISSCSNFEAFQARRVKARYRDAGGKKPELLHTLNGSGLAVGRTLVAILENYQRPDGGIAVPVALRPYLGGLEVLSPG